MEPNLSETSDNYKFIEKQIDDKHRIIRCKEDIQYISQIKTGGNAQRPWRAISFYVTKAGAKRQGLPFQQAALSLFPLDASVASPEGSAQPVDAFMSIHLPKEQDTALRCTRGHSDAAPVATL